MTNLLILIVALVVYAEQCAAQSMDERDFLIDHDQTLGIDESGRRSPGAHSSAKANSHENVQSGRPLQMPFGCYSCVNCPRVLRNTTVRRCPYTMDPDMNGKCVFYAEKYQQIENYWYVRGCASELGSCSDITRKQNAPTVNVAYCIQCEGDKCNRNGVSRSTADLTAAVFLLVVYPVLGKYTFS